MLVSAVAIQFAGCGAYSVVDAPSVNQSDRVDYVVLHFTSEDYAESMRLLTERTDSPVSAHYLIPMADDPSYPRRRLVVHRLVPEHRRAWHAGRSDWGDEAALNDRSIGIEIVNLSACTAEAPDAARPAPLTALCRFRPFEERQIELVIALLTDILERYPGIDPEDIVGHADIAPARKFDPGPLFPWRRLYEAGIGAWPDDATVGRYRRLFAVRPPADETLLRALRAWGYRVCDDENPALAFAQALRAFQMHFRPARVDARPDLETAALVYALLEKYRPEALATLDEYAGPAAQVGEPIDAGCEPGREPDGKTPPLGAEMRH